MMTEEKQIRRSAEAAMQSVLPPALKWPLVIYAIGIFLTSLFLRDSINPDGVSYLRNAQYLVDGRFGDSVSGYWSPLLSWSMAPLMLIGVDSMFAARIALGIWGALMLVACHWLIQKFSRKRAADWKHTLILLVLAVCSVHWATYVITPDLPLAVCLIFYCGIVLSRDVLTKKSAAAWCGIVGAIAYLTKSYALPFFMVHFPLSLVLLWAVYRDRYSKRQLGRAVAVGMLAFFAVAGPWIAALSWKYQRPTFSTVARIAHTVVGPGDKPRMHPLGGLHPVAEGRLNVWETPEALQYNHWFPLESVAYFSHQVQHTVRTSLRLMRDIGAFDLFYLSLPALIVTPFVIGRRRNARHAYLALWCLGTVVIYAAGFTMVYYANRYVVAFLWPLLFIYCAVFCLERLRLPGRKAAMLAALIFISFAAYAFTCCQSTWRQCFADNGRYRRIAAAIHDDCADGPLAYAGQPHEGLYIAYHLDKPFLGWLWTPREDSITEVVRALNERGATTLLVNSQWKLAEQFKKESTWQLRRTIPYGRISYELYVSPHQVTPDVAQNRSTAAAVSN